MLMAMLFIKHAEEISFHITSSIPTTIRKGKDINPQFFRDNQIRFINKIRVKVQNLINEF